MATNLDEAIWLKSFSISQLIRCLPDDSDNFDSNARKQRLFAAASCRRVLEYMSDSVAESAIRQCECQADSDDPPRSLNVLALSLQRHFESYQIEMGDDETDSYLFLAMALDALATSATSSEYIANQCRDALCGHDDFVAGRGEMLFQADLLRDIFGNPFRPVAFDPVWRTADATGIAARMYDSRDFSAMPILADALEEAGCTNADLLLHCRKPGVHVRGCRVFDLVLGKG